jgi:hypothetical protein
MAHPVVEGTQYVMKTEAFLHLCNRFLSFITGLRMPSVTIPGQFGPIKQIFQGRIKPRKESSAESRDQNEKNHEGWS